MCVRLITGILPEIEMDWSQTFLRWVYMYILQKDEVVQPMLLISTVNLQVTKLFIATSATKGGGGYHPLRFSVRFKILYRVIQPLIQHCLLHKMVYLNVIYVIAT